MQVKGSSWLSSRAPILMAALLGAIGLLSLALGVESRNSLSWVTHTSQVQTALTSVYTGFIDTLASEREFLVTGDDGQIAVSASRKKAVFDDLASLTDLIGDNHEQIRRLSELVSLVDQRVATGETLIGARRASGAAPEPLNQLVLLGQAQFDDVRAKIRAMQSSEDALYKRRTSSAAAVSGASRETWGPSPRNRAARGAHPGKSGRARGAGQG